MSGSSEVHLTRGGLTNSQSLLITWTILMFLNVVSSDPRNVALNKPIQALYTCGYFGRETYYNHKDVLKADRDRSEMLCEDTTVHPPQAMVDGDPNTKWQSANYYSFTSLGNFTNTTFSNSTDNVHAVIYLDLKQTFKVEKIILRLGDAKRPSFMAIHKAEDMSLGYASWAYKVNYASECSSKFSTPLIDVPENQGDAVCARYTEPAAKTFETIEFDFTAVPSELREWKRAKYIGIEFFDIERTLTLEAVRFQHFAVSEMEVMAECVCNGHEINCTVTKGTGVYECVCGGNTVGQFCERCQPFYNQKAWQFEVPCEECNCYNHATECVYVSELETNQLSLNKTGHRSGGGRCVNCKDNTAGENCEKCLPRYYRPVDKLQTDPDACVLCECNRQGSLAEDCVMNNDTAPPQGMQPGDCFCKANVTGTKCDSCKDGFFDLSEDNPNGCQECGCSPEGTVGASQNCVKNQTGQCSCKANVEGRACDVCKDGFYGLTANDPNGCKPCDCDPGGAVDQNCQKTTGQCICRPNVQGRQCNSAVPGYYSPDVHFIHVDFETAEGRDTKIVQPGFQGNGYVEINYAEYLTPVMIFPGGTSLSGKCVIRIRYSAPNDSFASMTIAASDPSKPMSVHFPKCLGKWCYTSVTDKTITLLGPTTHDARFVIMQKVLLDRLVCVPVEFLDTDYLLGSSAFSTNCDVLNNDMKVGTPFEDTCKSGLLSLMSYYLNGLISCDCSQLGSLNTVCDPFGGKCQCKPGAGDRQCDSCESGFFQLTETGCKDCNCATTSQCDKVTGQCHCPPNTIALRCDQCYFDTWDWDNTTGCKECNCNTTGSERTWCNQMTGVCECKTGVEGVKCDQCTDTYKGFNILGCSRCGCDMTGSSNETCDKSTGQCPCKENADSQLCNQCRPGSFHLHADNPKGCLDCICMGVASQCNSSTGRLQQKITVLIESEAGGLSGTVSVVDSNGGDLASPSVEVPPSNDSVATQTSLRVVVPPSGNVYWKIPDLTGNLLAVYGGFLQADVQYTGITSPGTPKPSKAILIGRNNKRFVYDIPAFNETNIKNIRIELKESEWKNEADNSQATRGEFVLALSEVKVIMVPAVFSAEDHASFLSHLEYSVDGVGGVVADSVEQCQCGEAYTGLSCESCAAGYKRTNVTGHNYLGECIPCACNGHTSSCDPDTGECFDCQHNTTGPTCEFCAAGYYGNATSGTDCNQCPCYQPRVANETCSMVNSSIKCTFCNPGYTGDLCDRCLDFHYGSPSLRDTGTCTPCDCNNKSTVCDGFSGQCVGCQDNTEGDNCERCIEGYYHNNVTNQCEVCGCSSDGSARTICDPMNGTCPCYPGIGGRTCDGCLDNYWGFADSTPGCLPCTCLEAGSVSLQCNAGSGDCECKLNVRSVGDVQCNQCVAGYYGLPNQECQACNCNATGTDPNSGTCDLVTGQCPCKPGVTGRQCDQCKTLYIDFSSSGCKACDRCQSSLGNDSKKLEAKWKEAYNLFQLLGTLQGQDKQLQVLHAQLTTMMTKLGLSNTSMSSVSEMTGNITALDTATKQQVNNLRDKVTTLQGISANQKNSTYTEDERLKTVLAESFNTLDLSRTETQKGFNYQYQLQQYDVTAQQYMDQGKSTGSRIGLNFDTQLRKATADNQTILNDLTVEKMTQETTQQDDALTALLRKEDTLREVFKAQSTSMTQMDGVLTKLQEKEAEISGQQTEAKASKQQAEARTAETEAARADISNISATAETLLQTAATAHQQCQTIMSGNASSLLTSVTLPSGVSNWITGYSVLQQLQSSILANVSIIDDSVKESEREAQRLETDAQELNKTFSRAIGRGDPAVKAIANFEKVILTLNNSLSTVDQAKQTIDEAQKILDTVSVSVLETQANTSQIESDQLLALINGISYGKDELNRSLDSGRTTLKKAKDQWIPVEAELDKLKQSAEQLNSTEANRVSTVVSEARALAGEANRTADTTQSTLANLNATLTGEKVKAEAVKSKVDQAVNLTRSVEDGARSLTGREDSLTRSVESITQQRNYAAGEKIKINNIMSSIESKLEEAMRLLGQLHKPVNFNGTSGISVSSPSQGVPLQYTDVQFKFKKDISVTNALLFFTENSPSSSGEFSVEIVDDRVQMEFNNSCGSVSIVSQADLCDNCWFHVQASKYLNMGQLTVRLLSTGGIATDAAMSTTTCESSSDLTLNTTLYYGSLPTDTVTSKVTNRSGFKGCIYDAQFNGAEIDIWKESVEAENPPTCCRKPIVPTSSLESGVSFDGFGELVINSTSLDVSLSPLTLTLKFRTFNPNAYLVLVASDNLKFSLHLLDGYIVFEYGSIGGVENRMKTSNRYNTGTWFGVAASKGPQKDLQVFHDDDPSISETVSSVTASDMDLSALKGVDIIIGSDRSPNSVKPGTALKRFSGCMKAFSYRVGSGLIAQIPLTASNVISQSGVSTTGCPAKVMPGIRFMSPSSYMSLSLPSVTTISTISMDIVTTQGNGILVHIQDKVTPSQDLYLGLFHGNLVLDYGISYQLSTSRLYISDGLLHEVKVAISSSPVIMVDGQSFVSNKRASTFHKSSVTPVHIGGSSNNSLLNSRYPVRSSFVGGVINLQINDNAIDVFANGIITGQQGSDLSGIPEPPTTPPPIPYTTPVPPTTPPPPTCGTLKVPSTNPNGIWFSGNSYWRKTLTDTEKAFYNVSLSLTVDFEAFGPNGLLFLAADHVLTPTEYLLIYLRDGFIHFNVTSPTFNDTLQSALPYNDGRRYTVDFLVYGTYLILTESVDRKDYASTDQGNPNFPHIFSNIAQVLLGGTNSTQTRPSFLHILPPVPDFQGGIFEVTIHSKQIGTISYNLKNTEGDSSVVQNNIGPVPSQVGYGVSLNGLNSYVNIGNHGASGQLVVSLTLSNINPSAMLFYIHQSVNTSIALDTQEYRLRVTVGSSSSSAFTAISSDLTNFCDGLPHAYHLTVNSTGVQVKVDENPDEFFSYPPNFLMSTITGGTTVVGGFHDRTLPFKSPVSRTSVQGCLQSVFINGLHYDPALYLSTSRGSALACPV